MRFAIFSDIHANLEALEAVLADARKRKCTHFVCLGDVVGYNANPRECVERVRELDCPVVKGNHDEAGIASPHPRTISMKSPSGPSQWTRDNLTDQDKEWLRSLPLQQAVCTILPSCTPRSIRRRNGAMFLTTLDAAASFTYQRTTVCFFGHTHVPMVFVRDESVRQERVEHIRIEPAKSISSTWAAWANHAMETGAQHAAFTISENNLVEQLRRKIRSGDRAKEDC